jgi:hypothetical protein
MTTVSTAAAVRVAASEVPKKADAYCFTTTTSAGPGSSAGTNSPWSPGASSASSASAGTLRTNRPPSAAPGR